MKKRTRKQIVETVPTSSGIDATTAFCIVALGGFVGGLMGALLLLSLGG